jgi:cell division septal protein FtsQ
LKEQVITPRMSARGAGATGKARAAGGIVQKPARRDRPAAGNGRNGSSTLRKVLRYLPLAGKIMLAIVAGVLLFAGYRAAASASFFQARTIDINPTTRANADDITRVVRHAVSQTGVWQLDLAAISAELERVPWVRRAVVSRVLPDGLRVRVTERTPLAVVRYSNGKLVWVDEEAVALDVMSPSDRQPAFFIRGWDEAATGAARDENRLRIQKYAELLREWDGAGLSERVSEVNLGDVRDVRAQLAGDDSQIEVRLGGKDFGNRLRRAFKVLDEQRNTPRGPFITRIETLDNRTIVGTSSGAQISSESAGDAPPAQPETVSAAANAPARREAEPARPPKPSKKGVAEAKKKDKDKEKQERAKKQDKKEEARNKAKGETRPRRVG